jgi:hypothetical protein
MFGDICGVYQRFPAVFPLHQTSEAIFYPLIQNWSTTAWKTENLEIEWFWLKNHVEHSRIKSIIGFGFTIPKR